MALDLTGITNTIYARLATASAGATARAALGTTSSVIPADRLKTYNTSSPMPTRVLAAFRMGDQIGNPREGIQMRFSWWLYDDERYEYIRINAVIPLLMALYPDEAPLGVSYIRYNGASQEAPDPLYKMPCRRMTWTAFTR